MSVEKLSNIKPFEMLMLPFLIKIARLERPQWPRDDYATLFAHDLLAATPIQAGAGVEVYQLSRGLQLDDQENPNLFVRSSAKEIWQKIASKTRPDGRGGGSGASRPIT